MSIFNRKKNKARDAPKNWTLTSGAPDWFAGRTSSGQIVSPTTAMQLTAVYSCIRILSEAIAELPLHVYRYTPDGGKVKAIEDPRYFLLHDEPNPEMTSYIWRETMMTHLCLRGNAYSQIVYNGRGQIVALYPLMPDQMTIERTEDGRLIYWYQRSPEDVRPGELTLIKLQSWEVLHVPGLGYNGLVGFSPIQVAKNAIGSALAAEDYSGHFFENAAMPSGVIEYDGVIKDPDNFREKFSKQFSGAVHSGKTPVLEEGMKYKQISLSPQDAQFLEQRKFSIDEIARIFRVPPHMLADLEKSSYSNIEQQSLEFVKYTIAPWVARWEQQLKKALFDDEEKRRMFCSFNLEGLMRGDYKSRMDGYAIARQNGWMSANDIRELENMNRISDEEGGNLYLINGNMLPLSDAGAFANKATTGKEGADG